MTARDSRGRFVSPDAAAAERVLQRAVEEAIAVLRRGLYKSAEIDPAQGGIERVARRHIEADHRFLAKRALEHAAHAAEPLLRGAK